MSSLLDGLGGKAAPEEEGPITSKSALTPPKAEKTGAAATAAAAADDEEEPTPKPKTAVGKEAVGDEDKPGVKPKVPIEEETAGPLKPPKAAATATETETGKVKGSEADPAAATSTDITAKQAYDRCVNAVDKSKCGDALAAWVYVIIAGEFCVGNIRRPFSCYAASISIAAMDMVIPATPASERLWEGANVHRRRVPGYFQAPRRHWPTIYTTTGLWS